MSVRHFHSSTLFVTRDGAPMRFYVRPGPMKRQLAPLITHGGGVVCRIQEPGAFLLADPTEGQLGPGYISTAYVSDCVGSNRCLSPRAYRLLPPLGQTTRAGQSQQLYSKLTTSHGVPGWVRDHKSSAVDLTDKEEGALKGNVDTCTSMVTTKDAVGLTDKEDATLKGNVDTCTSMVTTTNAVGLTDKEDATIQDNVDTCSSRVTTTEESAGELEDNLEQMRNLISEMTRGDREDIEERSALDLTSKEDASTIQGTSMVTTAEEEVFGEQEDNMEEMENLSFESTPGDKELSAVDPANKEYTAISGKREDITTLQGNMDTCSFMVTTTKEGTGKQEVMEQVGNPGSEITHRGKEGLKECPSVDLANKEEPTIQGNMDTCSSVVTTKKEGTGGQEDNIEQMEILCSERNHGDEENLEGSSSVDLTKKEERAVQDRTCTSIVTTTREATSEDNTKKNGITSPKRTSAPLTKSLASGSRIPIEAASRSREDLKTAASPRDGTCTEAATGDGWDKSTGETHSSCSGAQKEHPLRKMDVEQTLNEDENFSILVIPDPRTSTPDLGNPNTVKDLETYKVQDSVLGKDGESPLETEFRRPVRKVASKSRFFSRVNQDSPDMKQNRAEKQIDVHTKPKDETPMSVQESHCGQAEPETQNYSAGKPDVQSADSQQGQSFVSFQGPISAATLRKGRMAFTNEEDMAILLYIRDHVSSICTVTGNILWKEMEKKKVLGRTWQAMKARYVKYLVNHKYKYKLPPKCPPLPNKDSSSRRMQGLAELNSLQSNSALNSTGTPQKRDTTLPSTSDDVPQKRDTTLPSASDDVLQKRDTTLPSASDDVPQKRDTTLPSTSVVSAQNLDTVLPSAPTDSPQKVGLMLPIACTVTPKKCDTMLPSSSTDTPPNNDHVPPATSANLQKAALPSTSADTYQSCSITQRGASTSTNILANNVVLKGRSILTDRKRSRDPTNDDESSPPEKGSRALISPHSSKTVLSRNDDSSDSEDLHIFARANMEFEESDDTIVEQPPPVATQTEDQNNPAKHMDEMPSTSEACDSEEDPREAVIDMTREFKLDVSCITQALFFNNGELGSTRHFLRTGTRPDGYPIWEPKDDRDLQKGNPKTQFHLISKYGSDNVARRAAFLES